MKKLSFILLAVVASLGLATVALAQTCQEIHGLGTNGCAPSPFDGAEVTVTGVVYVEAGTYNDGAVYWQCPGGSGGLTFYDTNAAGLIFLGDEIEVSGTVGAFGAEIQINSAVYTVLTSGNATTPLAIGTGDLADGTDMLGDFMSVQGVLSLVSAGFNSTYEVDDGSGPVIVFVDGTTGIDTAMMDMYLGDEVMISGATKCYDGVGELLPRNDNDITLITIATEQSSWGALKARY